MSRITIFVILSTLIMLGCFGCQATPLEKNWGRSFESARYNQILNPEAEENLAPVEGMEGPAAERTFNKHLSGKNTEQKSSSEFGVLTIKK